MTAPRRGEKTGGRRSKLTPELIAQVEIALQGHNTVETTCAALGFSREAFYRWMREGEEATTGIKRQFHDTVLRAQGTSKMLLVNAIAKDPDWKAKAFLLERMHPKEFGKRTILTGPDAESPVGMPAGSGGVQVTIQLAGTDGPQPWTFAKEPDPEPTDGTDPWATDKPEFPAEPPPNHPPQPGPPPPPPTVLPGRGPAFPPRPQPTPPTARPKDPDA